MEGSRNIFKLYRAPVEIEPLHLRSLFEERYLDDKYELILNRLGKSINFYIPLQYLGTYLLFVGLIGLLGTHISLVLEIITGYVTALCNPMILLILLPLFITKTANFFNPFSILISSVKTGTGLIKKSRYFCIFSKQFEYIHENEVFCKNIK